MAPGIVTIVSPMKRGLKVDLENHRDYGEDATSGRLVTIVSPMKRGLKARVTVRFIGIYEKPCTVTIVSPMKRGLKASPHCNILSAMKPADAWLQSFPR